MLEYQGQKFKDFLIKLKGESKNNSDTTTITFDVAAQMLGIKRPSLYQYFESANLKRETVKKITETFNVTEEEIWGDTNNPIQSANTNNLVSNAKFIGNLEEPEDADGNTKFVEISPGRYRMKVDFIPLQARAGYLATFGDSTIYEHEEFPKHEVTVSVYHKGKYIAIEAVGDSMFDGTIDSIPNKTILTCRELPKHYWTSNFHTHNFKYWVFVHRNEGMLVKMIKSHNPQTGDVVLASLNPNKILYPDIEINLKDVYQVLNVCKREME